MKWLSKYEIAQAGMTKAKGQDTWENERLKELTPPGRPPFNLQDPRKIRATTGAPINPNVDLVSAKHDLNSLDDIMQYARKHNLSKEDMYNLAAMDLQETQWGKTDPQTGHVMGNWGGSDVTEDFVRAYKSKMKTADRLNLKDPAERLQVYNGRGTVFPTTEEDYHGFEMKKIYGVDLPKEGINLRKRPLYGEQVLDLRDNVLKKNPDVVKYIDSTFSSTKPLPNFNEDGERELSSWEKSLMKKAQSLPKKQDGGWLSKYQDGAVVKDDKGYWNPDNHGKVVEIGSNNITMKGVDQPLIGISDTGDIQYMEPGQDYKFKGEKVTEYPVKQNGGCVTCAQEGDTQKVDTLGVEDYRKRISEGNYNMETPYQENTGVAEDDMWLNNCINGVCTAINSTLGDESPLDKNYIGNMSFEDNTKKLGYTSIGRRNVKELFPGDILQYQALKNSVPDKFPTVGEDSIETFPFHASMVVRQYEKDGVPMVTLANNSGGDTMEEKSYPLEELMMRIKGNNEYPEGATVQRYDPEGVASAEQKSIQQEAEIAGDNEYANLYDTSAPTADVGDTDLDFSWTEVGSAIFNPIDKLVDLYDQTQAPKKLSDAYTKNYKEIGKTSNVPPKVLDKMFTIQVGLAKQETRFGTSAKKSIKDSLPESWYPALRDLKDTVSMDSGKIPGWIQEYYKNNVNGVRGDHSSVRQFAAHIKQKYGDVLTSRNRNNSKKSKGMFQQKELSPRGRHLKADLSTTEGQFLGSMGLMLDNYHTAKKQYNVSEEKLLDITTLMHNAPELAKIPEYVNYFIQRGDSDYVNKVRGKKEPEKQEKTPWLEKY